MAVAAAAALFMEQPEGIVTRGQALEALYPIRILHQVHSWWAVEAPAVGLEVAAPMGAMGARVQRPQPEKAAEEAAAVQVELMAL